MSLFGKIISDKVLCRLKLSKQDKMKVIYLFLTTKIFLFNQKQHIFPAWL